MTQVDEFYVRPSRKKRPERRRTSRVADEVPATDAVVAGAEGVPTAVARRRGPLDAAPSADVLDRVRSLQARWPDAQLGKPPILQAAAVILDWLATQPGDGWQERWDAAVPDDGRGWIELLAQASPWQRSTHRVRMQLGLSALMLVRLVLPSYRFLRSYNPKSLYACARETFRPELFAAAEHNADRLGVRDHQRGLALAVLSNLVLHTGKDLDQLSLDDFNELREIRAPQAIKPPPGVTVAWDLVRGIAQIPDESLQRARLGGQRSTEDLVDSFGLACRPVRDIIVRYLNERRPVLDHSTFATLARTLAAFWADIEAHHPGIDSPHLPDDVAEAWRQRVSVVVSKDGTTRPRLATLNVFVPIRAFYLDIAQWALTDPTWAPYAVPSPVRSCDTDGHVKTKQQVAARMHQRIRERLPHLLTLVDSANGHRLDQADLLAAAQAVAPGQEFTHANRRLRVVPHPRRSGPIRRAAEPAVVVEDVRTGERRNLSFDEDAAFWTWAIIETLRHTGIRVEELLELTQLAVVSYRLADTGEVIPLLQIVPSKSNEERLLLITPELASVLATVISRLRRHNDGSIALVARFDRHERTWGPALPFLFQRIRDHRRTVLPPDYVNRLLRQAWQRADIRDSAGNPIYATAHDFRRMFVTEAVTGGLPIHIAAKLLGHANVTTTQAYHAVFQDELIRSYRAFLDARRATRPTEEYREPTPEEWAELQQHFQSRKLELGDCGRPYGSPCQHEHACIRCPMLRVDPRAHDRVAAIISNLRDRIDEARINGWHGEVQGLQTSLSAAAAKMVSLERSTRATAAAGPVNLGLPARRQAH